MRHWSHCRQGCLRGPLQARGPSHSLGSQFIPAEGRGGGFCLSRLQHMRNNRARRHLRGHGKAERKWPIMKYALLSLKLGTSSMLVLMLTRLRFLVAAANPQGQ